MRIGVPKEIKVLEYRVGMVPSSVRELVADGHEVVVETNAGMGIGMTDADYERAGAKVLGSAKEVFDAAELIVKVKEPQLVECEMLRSDQVIFTTCTWPRIPSRPRVWSNPARPRSPMRPSPPTMAHCRS